MTRPSVPVGSSGGELRRLFEAGAVAAPDRDLLERFRRTGDAGAFTAIVDRHGAAVARACRSILGRPADVDDAFQATFLVLVRRAGAIRDGDRLAPWLVGVARRVALRAKARARRRGDREAGTPAELAELPDRPGAVDPARRELGRLVRAELGQLPRPEQLAVALCDLDGLSHREAADRLGWPLGTVKTRVARGRSRLRTRLIRRGLVPALPWLGDALAREGARSAAVARALAGPVARAASLIVSGRAIPAGLLAPGARALADRAGRGLLVAPGVLAVAGLGVLLALGARSSGHGLPSAGSPRTQASAGAPAPPIAEVHPRLDAPGVAFERTVIDPAPLDARRVEVADIDGDRRPDVLVVGSDTIVWYQNPTWTRRVVTAGGRPVGLAIADASAADVDGDGRAEVAIAADSPEDDPKRGQLLLARPGARPDDPWTVAKLRDLPMAHRVCWGDLDGDGKPELVAAARGVPTENSRRGRPDAPEIGVFKLDPATFGVARSLVRTVEGGSRVSAIEILPPLLLPRRAMVGVATGSGLRAEFLLPIRGKFADRGAQLVPISNFEAANPAGAVDQGGRAFRYGRAGATDHFAVAVGPNPGATLTVWERREWSDLPPRVEPEKDPEGAARRQAALWERVKLAARNPLILGRSGPLERPEGAGRGGANGSDRLSLNLFNAVPLFLPGPLDAREEGRCVAVADFDGDCADEIVAGYAGARHGLVRYRREGKAWAGADIDRTDYPHDLREGDLDGDGVPDLVALNSQGPGLVWHRAVRPGPPPMPR